jgi:colanic acid biosynthesis glycosyl transferase WcaI
MRLLIIGLNFAPEPIGVGKYTGEMAAWFAARGHDVDVVTAPPYYPWWRRQPGYPRWRWGRETWKNCRVIRCPIYVPHQPTGLLRVLHLASFAIAGGPAALYCALRRKPDVVCAIVPTLFAAPIALAVARLAGAKACLHVQDLEIEAGHDLGVSRRGKATGIALTLEAWLLRRFDLVSSISQKMLDRIGKKGVSGDRLMLFPNWVKTSEIFPMKLSVNRRRQLGVAGGQCIVMYAGSMGAKQGLETVLAAARILEHDGKPSPFFIFAGDGHGRAKLEAAAKNLSNVRFLPVVPQDLYNEFLNLGDIHLLPQKAAAADLVLPSKIYAILAAGKPLVATVSPDTQVAQLVAQAGAIVPPGDADALAGAIRALARDPARRRAMGKAALRIARKKYESDLVLGSMEARLMDELSEAAVEPAL